MPTTTLYATQDAYSLNDGWNASQVFNQVGIYNDKSGTVYARGWAKWGDVVDIPSDSIVSAATIQVFVTNAADGSTNARPTDICRVTATWSEGAAPAATPITGAFDATTRATIGVGDGSGNGGWSPVPGTAGNSLPSTDLASLVQEWVNGTYPNYGVVFDPNEVPSTSREFASIENTSHSQAWLAITYNRPPSAPTITAPAAAAVIPVGAATAVTITAGTDPEADTITHYYEVSIDGGAYSVFATSTSTSQNYTPTAAGTYAFRVRSRDVSASGAYSAYSSVVTVTAKAGGPRMIVG